MDEFIHWPKPYLSTLVNNLWWHIVMDEWNLDENSHGNWRWMQHYESMIISEIYNEWQIVWVTL